MGIIHLSCTGLPCISSILFSQFYKRRKVQEKIILFSISNVSFRFLSLIGWNKQMQTGIICGRVRNLPFYFIFLQNAPEATRRAAADSNVRKDCRADLTCPSNFPDFRKCVGVCWVVPNRLGWMDRPLWTSQSFHSFSQIQSSKPKFSKQIRKSQAEIEEKISKKLPWRLAAFSSPISTNFSFFVSLLCVFVQPVL